MNVRSGEPNRTWFRASRFYNARGSWFCVTREGPHLGPCDSRADAEVELMMYMRHLHEGRPARDHLFS